MITILMSIKKEHFDALCKGIKKHEFRRAFAPQTENFIIVFYATEPISAIYGYGLFGPPIIGPISKMVEIVKTHQYSSPENIINYFAGKNKGFAIPCIYAKILKQMTLLEIQKTLPRFTPPQSYIYMDKPPYNKLLEKIALTEIAQRNIIQKDV